MWGQSVGGEASYIACDLKGRCTIQDLILAFSMTLDFRRALNLSFVSDTGLVTATDRYTETSGLVAKKESSIYDSLVFESSVGAGGGNERNGSRGRGQ